jgi:EAL domain-containing protein (putative c-di-GMP-specific phosphodiesterase class I)
VESLIAEAQMATLEARNSGCNRVAPFTAEMREKMRSRVGLEQDLRRAVSASEFELHFQPIIPLGGRGNVSLEALLRWRHPRRGLLAPAEFIEVAVQSGVMLELGRHVLHTACEGIANLRARTGMADLEVTINMSAPEVLLPGTAETVRAALEQNNLSPQTVTIEITESAFMVDLARAAAAIGEIRALGVRVSLDDFGTAYSSLSWLRSLPIEKLKIDRSYVSGIEREPFDLAIVKSIVDLAKAFKRDVVAEGVETTRQLQTLRELGVDFAQGFLFAQARPMEDFDADRLHAMCAIPARVSDLR